MKDHKTGTKTSANNHCIRLEKHYRFVFFFLNILIIYFICHYRKRYIFFCLFVFTSILYVYYFKLLYIMEINPFSGHQ